MLDYKFAGCEWIRIELSRLFLVFILTALIAKSPLFAQEGNASVRLIVRVDDMGCSHATNLGIMRSIREGIATSVEIMVPTPWYPEAVAMLKEVPQVDVGIHITLTSEWTNLKWRPVTFVPSLADARGYFYPMIWPNATRPGSALQEHNYSINEIEQEVRAQIEIAQRDFPNLTHFSAHMGCANLSVETKALFKKLAVEYEIDIFPEKQGVRRLPYSGNNQMPAELRVQEFIKTLRGLSSGTYMFVEHPAEDSSEQQAIGHPGYEHVATDRAAVLEMLIDPAVKKEINDLGIQLISYADLK